MESPPLRLHLGCGERYLPGYVNIDFPPQAGAVLDTSKADLHADITTLSYPPGTVAEVRLHHVFEHFDRPTALRLLLDWYDWLLPGGRLVIETPDFARCARAFLLPWKRQRRGVIVRHLFGSHEAAWAVHKDGWYRSKYRHVLKALGFGNLRFRRSRWRSTYNLTVHARKPAGERPRAQREAAAAALLRESMVDQSASEQRLLDHWLRTLSG